LGGTPTKHLSGSKVWLGDENGWVGAGIVRAPKMGYGGRAMIASEVMVKDSKLQQAYKNPTKLFGAFQFRSPVWERNQKLYTKVVKALEQTYGCLPKDLLVNISPSLGPNHSEFIHYKEEFPKEFWRYLHKPNYLDLWKLAEDELLAAGLLKENIAIAKMCTFENMEHFYSYRRDKSSKRNASVITLI